MAKMKWKTMDSGMDIAGVVVWFFIDDRKAFKSVFIEVKVKFI